MSTVADQSTGLPNGSELIARAESLIPMLREHALDAETARRVPTESFDALRRADLMRAYVPQRHGGCELHPRDFWRVAAAISRGCPSTAWVFSVLSCHTFVFAMFSEQAQTEVFGDDPNVGISGVLPDRSTVRAVDGGYVLQNGRWPFGSGCHNAGWAMLGAQVAGEPPGYDKAFLMLPMEHIEILDDWHVAGLRATGSNTLTLKEDEVFVPAHRVLKAEIALSHKYGAHRERLYRTPFAPVLALSLGLGTTIGAAEAALSHFESLAVDRSDRRMVYTDDLRKSELPATRRTIASATVRLEAARLLADRACDLAWDAAGTPDEVVHNELRAKLRLFGVHVAHECREIVNALYLESGGSSLSERSVMQRLNRDVQAMTMHEAMHLAMIEDTYGRVRLGQATSHWLL